MGCGGANPTLSPSSTAVLFAPPLCTHAAASIQITRNGRLRGKDFFRKTILDGMKTASRPGLPTRPRLTDA